jgi:hypothetical protein
VSFPLRFRTEVPDDIEGSWRHNEMDEMLTVGEMQSRFVAEWILVEDPETNDALEVQSGPVRFHSKDRDEVYRKAVELRPARFAVLYRA